MDASISFNKALDQSQLHSYFNRDYKGELSSHKRWNVVWKIAALASVVAFAVLAAVATALTYLTAPVYLPVLFTAALATLAPAYSFFEWMWKGKAAGHSAEAEVLQPIVDAIKELPKGSGGLEQTLHALGVTEVKSDQVNVKALKPILGHYNAFEADLKKIAAEVDKVTQELFTKKSFTTSYVRDKEVEEMVVQVETHGRIGNLNRQDPESLEGFMAVKDKFADLEDQQALQGKLRITQSHLIHVMRNPRDPKSFGDHFRTFEFLSRATRESARTQGDPHADIFALRLDNQKAFTLVELKEKSIVELTETLFSRS
ncbi:MAG: hypothetical protein K940chlam2_00255 [Chlamydiae bacterium]|nr:hypothetical protein [Chlamydiota bacterium]